MAAATPSTSADRLASEAEVEIAPPASTARGERGLSDEDGLAEVVSIRQNGRGPRAAAPASPLSAIAVLVAAALALSPLWAGYYDQGLWEPLAIGAVTLLVVVVLTARPVLTPAALVAGVALLALMALSAVSMLWAQSKESAWTDSNQLALYVVIFAIGLVAVRERRPARLIVLLLGVPALITSVLLCLVMIGGGGQSAFLTGRLNSPLGYINGTAGLLVMGLWPWLSLAETAGRRVVRSASLAGAAMIAATTVLTQSRAIVPAIALAAIAALVAAPQRTRRAVHLLLIAVAVAASLHWTLAVYSSTGPLQLIPPPHAVLRRAGLAIVILGALAGLLRLAISAAASKLSAGQRERLLELTARTLIAVTVAAVVAIGVFAHKTIVNQYDAFTQLKVEQSASNRFLTGGGYRYDLWRVAIDEFKAHPLAGVGAGNYDSYYYVLRHNSSQYVMVPHSLELQFAAELGILGVVTLLVFCGTVLWAGMSRRRRALAAQDPMVTIAAIGIFTAWLTGTSVDWLYNFPGLAGAAFLAAALILVPIPATDSVARPTIRSWPPHRSGPGSSLIGPKLRMRPIVLVLAMGTLAFVAASIGRQYAASRYAATGARETDTSPEQALSTLRTAEQLDPFAMTTYYNIAAAYARLDDYQDARAALLRAQQQEPLNYVPPALLGDLAMRRGLPRAALADYERASRLNPRDPIVAAALVQVKAALS